MQDIHFSIDIIIHIEKNLCIIWNKYILLRKNKTIRSTRNISKKKKYIYIGITRA